MTKNRILSNSGWWILSFLSLIPLILWILQTPLSFRISSLPLFARSLGDVFGLCGMAMFSLVMILSARLKIFEKFFNGINESYTAHHFFGGLSLVLLLFHPLFLVYNYLLVSFSAAALFLLPGDNFAQNFGTASLFVMIITLVITFYTKLKYQIWKFTHKFLGLAFIFAFFHVFFIGADISTNFPLKIYLFILAILAIITYFYRTLFADFFVRVFDYKVKNILQLEDKIWEIEFELINKEIKFTPGQFGFIKFHSNNLTKEPHPFSFSSADGKLLKIAIKELGDFTNKIGNLKVGDLAKIEGPFGSFNFKNHSKNQIWVAGGVGITPFLSMARSLTNNEADYKIDLYYSIRDDNCMAFCKEFKEISENNKNLNIILWNTKEKGFLTADSIKNNILNIKDRDILICGPGPMMSAIKKQFLDAGIKEKNIHTEEFQLY